jgi:NAD(P)-dependent dehydrogenase (short-subunit alcohol dehydrogenase family)
MARAFGEAGMKLVLADIEDAALEAARVSLAAEGHDVLALCCDVSRYADLQSAAQRTLERFGAVHLVCNNAGVGLEGPVDTWTDEGWAWVLGVNVMGVVHGVRAFTPHLKANPGGGHIVNTASIGGLTAAPNHGQYAASKFAVVGLSQSLRAELAPFGIGVTVLCPGFVRSHIATSARNAPGGLADRQSWLMREGFSGDAAALFSTIEQRVGSPSTLGPEAVGVMARQAVIDNDFYVLTETEFASDLERRLQSVGKAIAKARARG